MKVLPALAALFSILACALWIGALSGPWYHTQNLDGTEQRMGLYDSYRERKPYDERQHGHKYAQDYEKHNYEYEHGYMLESDDIVMTTTDLSQQDKSRDTDEYDYQKHHKHEREHRHKHKHGRNEAKEDQDTEKEKEQKEKKEYPTLQPIIIKPITPDNINGPTTSAPMSSQPTGTRDLQPGAGGGFGGGGFGGGGFGPWGGAGGGGGGMPVMKPTPGPTAMPVDSHQPPTVATPVPTSKHGHVYRQPHHHDNDRDQNEEKQPHKHDDEDRAQDEEKYERMSLNQVLAGNKNPEQEGTSQEEGEGQGGSHGTKHPPAGRRLKKHGTKHEIERNNEFPYDETWVKAMKILLYLAIIVSGIAALLQLLMAWTVGQKLHQGSWTTSPITAIITTTLITLAGIHGLIVLFLFMSKRDELPKHGSYDYAHTLNIVATILSFISPILFWYTLETRSKYETLLGEENTGARRKYASVE